MVKKLCMYGKAKARTLIFLTKTIFMIMKNLIFLFSFFAILMASTVQVNAQYTGYLMDTLESSSSVDTVILYPGGTTFEGAATSTLAKAFTVPGDLDVIIHTDSLTGSTNATLYLEVANATTPNIWYRASTTTLNGAAVQQIHYEDNDFVNRKWRLWAVTASGTQNTRIKAEWNFKPQ